MEAVHLSTGRALQLVSDALAADEFPQLSPTKVYIRIIESATGTRLHEVLEVEAVHLSTRSALTLGSASRSPIASRYPTPPKVLLL